MAYADCAEKRWDSYFALIEPLAKAMPWMVNDWLYKDLCCEFPSDSLLLILQ